MIAKIKIENKILALTIHKKKRKIITNEKKTTIRFVNTYIFKTIF